MFINRVIKFIFLGFLVLCFSSSRVYGVQWCSGYAIVNTTNYTCTGGLLGNSCLGSPLKNTFPCSWVKGTCARADVWTGSCTDNPCTPNNPSDITTSDCSSCTQVDGGWSNCPNSCGYSRSCDNPSPSCHGAACDPTQSKCPNNYAGTPGVPTLVDPVGSSDNPVNEIPGPVPVSWTKTTHAGSWDVLITNLDTGVTILTTKIGTTDTTIPNIPIGNVYSWEVRANNTICGGTSNWSSLGYFRTDYIPKIESITVKNSNGATVTPDSLNRNNICQRSFVYDPLPRRAAVVVQLRDNDDLPDHITEAQLRWNGRVYTIPFTGPVSHIWTGTVTIDYPIGDNNVNPYDWEVEASGTYVSSGWIA